MIELTTKVDKNSAMYEWAERQPKPEQAKAHIGTHIDVYNHTEIPLEYVKRRGIIFDVRGMDLIDIDPITRNKIEKGGFIIFRTGMMEKYGYDSHEYFENHPELSDDLINYLITKGVSFIGIDACGIKKGPAHEAADRFCEMAGVYVIENLSNLDKVKYQNIKAYTMWFENEEATALACRVIIKERKGL